MTFLLGGYVAERGLGAVLNGPAVLRLRPRADKEPDLFFIRRDRNRAHARRGRADLVVEVITALARS